MARPASLLQVSNCFLTIIVTLTPKPLSAASKLRQSWDAEQKKFSFVLALLHFWAQNYSMKTTRTPPPPPPEDWHPADIICALRKAGWSLRRLSAHHGFHPGSLQVAAYAGKWPAGERLIAAALGVTAPEIWPSRYAERAAKRAARAAQRGAYVKGSRARRNPQTKPLEGTPS